MTNQIELPEDRPYIIKLCESKCENCSKTTLNQMRFMVNVLYEIYGDGILPLTQNFCWKLNYCPECGLIDFQHLNKCNFGNQVKDLARRYSDMFIREKGNICFYRK